MAASDPNAKPQDVMADWLKAAQTSKPPRKPERKVTQDEWVKIARKEAARVDELLNPTGPPPTSPQQQPTTPKRPVPEPDANLPAGKAGRLAVDIHASRLPDFVAKLTGTGTYWRPELGVRTTLILIDRSMDRLVASITQPSRHNDRVSFKPPVGHAAVLTDGECQTWLSKLLVSVRETSTSKGLPLCVLIEPNALMPNVAAEAIIRTQPDLTTFFEELAETHDATVAVIDDVPGYRPQGANSAQFIPLGAAPDPSEIEGVPA
jgi:hypothetical protein